MFGTRIEEARSVSTANRIYFLSKAQYLGKDTPISFYLFTNHTLH